MPNSTGSQATEPAGPGRRRNGHNADDFAIPPSRTRQPGRLAAVAVYSGDVGGTAPDAEAMLDRVAGDIAGLWRKARNPGLQLVILDRDHPPSDESLRDGHRLSDLLAARGVPPAAVRLLQDAPGKSDQNRLLADCLEGNVAVLVIPSPVVSDDFRAAVTPHLSAVHLLRGRREYGAPARSPGGSSAARWYEVTVADADSMRWSLPGRKPALMEQIMSGTGNSPRIVIPGDGTLPYAELKEIAGSNPDPGTTDEPRPDQLTDPGFPTSGPAAAGQGARGRVSRPRPGRIEGRQHHGRRR
jgi:hypothetical protein